MIRYSFNYFPIWLAFFLTVSVLKFPREASALNSEVSKALPQFLQDAELDLTSRLQVHRANANSSSYSSFLSGRFWWKAVEDDDTSWPVLTLGWRTILAMIFGAVAATLSSASGIGGGALYVPIFNLLLGFDSKTSAALSSFMIFGGTLFNLLWYFAQKHPQVCDKPLLDYDVALIFQPNVLLGISVGVLCNVMSPDWLITALLILVLSYMTVRSCSGAFRRWNAESSVERVFVDKPEEHDYAAVDGNCGVDISGQLAPPISCHDRKEEGKDALQQPLLEYQRQTYGQIPATKIAMLALIWLGFFAEQLVEGIASAQNLWNIEDCGITYWLITLSQLPLAVIMTACIVYYFTKYSKPLDDCDIVNSRSLRALPVLALSAGLLGGMLGVGGGMVISPLLMEIGMHPQVTAATCSFIIFFSSSLSVVKYWFLGKIPLAWGLWSAALSVVFSIVGLQLVQTFICKFGRVSAMLFIYSFIIGVSAVLMASFGILDIWSDLHHGAYMGFTSPC